ncbi:MAG: PAS domain-containing protein, partial [Planctomycetia bacterium]|nr:PAS domain-containing protein [Planctomycetia bacterium]
MQELAIFISLGGVILAFSIYKNQQLINSHFTHNYQKAWTILKSLMIVFFFGYMAILIFVFFGYSRMIQSFSGALFFLVTLFVYLTVRTGFNTINELHNTTVSKEYVDKVVDSMADTLIVIKVGPDLLISKVNQATLNLLDYKYDEIINQPVSNIFRSEKDLDYYLDKCNTDSWITNEDAIYFTKNEEKIPVLLSIACIKDPSGNIEELIIAAQDIKERIKSENALRKSERKYRKLSKELIESNLMKKLLLDIITHDLKNPIGIIKGFADYEKENDHDNENLQYICTASDKLLKVIDNATVISRVAAGDKIDKEDIDLTKMIRNLTTDFASQLKSVNMKLEFKIKNQIIIKANPIISEVFQNYITNAIKYSSSGGKLIINANESDSVVTFNFVDLGDTIPKKDRKNIFNRNIQLNKTP